MNDDLKAYIDGELPPGAAERLHAALEADAALARETESIRQIGLALRSMPEPEPVGQAATLAALSRPRPSLLPNWSFALAGCVAVLMFASWVAGSPVTGRWTVATLAGQANPDAAPVEIQIPGARKQAFIRFIHERGGQVRLDGDALRVFYRSGLQGELSRRFLFPEGTPYAADGLRVHFVR